MDFLDVLEDPVVRFQETLDPWYAQYMCFVFTAQVAVYGWGETGCMPFRWRAVRDTFGSSTAPVW